jgi:hypothetical protein
MRKSSNYTTILTLFFKRKATRGFRIFLRSRGQTRAPNRSKRIEKGTPLKITEGILYALCGCEW